MSLGIHFNGFWSGFHNKMNATHDEFFLKLFSLVYDTPVYIADYESAEILIENTQVQSSLRTSKNWKHTYLFSGESYLHKDANLYSCVLYGQRTHKNRVNVPLYVVHMYCANKQYLFTENKLTPRSDIPTNDVVVIVRNPSGSFRNLFLDQLQTQMNVTYAGPYRNTTGKTLDCLYNSEEFFDYVRQFKFIITMENSKEDTYITEKITHGFLSSTIPIYWGAPRIEDYFNSDRFINVKNETQIQSCIQKMKSMTDSEWLHRVNSNIFTEFGQSYTIEAIAQQVQNVIFNKQFPLLKYTVFLCNPIFEPERYKNLQAVVEKMNLQPYEYIFISPTYKHTITDEIYKKYVKDDIVRRVRWQPTRKAELSLTLNTRAAYIWMVYF